MKMLHVIYTQGISGAEKHIGYLLPKMKVMGYESHLIIICPPLFSKEFTNFLQYLQENGVKAEVFTATKWQFFAVVKFVKNYIKKNGIKLVHSHLLKTDLYLIFVRILLGENMFLVSTKHGYDESVLNVYQPDNFNVKKNLYFFISKLTLKVIDANITISKGMAEMFKNLQLSKSTYPIVSHGVEINAEASTKQKNSKMSEQQIVITGRLETMKGHKYLIDAMKIVVAKYPNAKLLIIGNGSLRAKLEAQRSQLNLDRNIDFLGFQTNPYHFIAHSDVVVQPSLFEPFGLVYIEAFALGKAVIAFNTHAANEIIVTEETGFLVTPKSATALADTILQLLNDKSVRIKLDNAALLSYQENYTVEKMAQRMDAFYTSLNLN